MGTKLIKILECLPEIVKNVHLDVSLSGWSAVAAVGTICVSTVVISVVKTVNSENTQDLQFDPDTTEIHSSNQVEISQIAI